MTQEKKPQEKRIRAIITINPERCKGCRFCIDFCPHKALELSQDFNLHGYHLPKVKDVYACVGCTFCERICPDFAIVVTKVKKGEKNNEQKKR